MKRFEHPPAPDDVVISGIGLVAGSITEPEELFWHLADGGTIIREHPQHREWGVPAWASGHVTQKTINELQDALPEEAGRGGPAGVLGWHAAQQAWERSGLPDRLEGDRGGVFVGCNLMAMDPDLAALFRFYDPNTGLLDFDGYIDADRGEPDRHVQYLPDTMTAAMSGHFGLTGAVETHAEACAAGAVAIGIGYQQIRAGDLDVALVGGAERLTTYSIMHAFISLGALAPTGDKPISEISRPFDKDRSGFVIADAAAFLVLERRSHAEARGAQAVARVIGYAGVAEAVRITSSQRDGTAYATCMRTALADAGLSPSDVDHVNAHGTSTRANEECEAAALRNVFGSDVGRVSVTGVKSALGHSLGASGAMGAALSVLSLQEQLLLPTLNFNEPDTTTEGLDVVTQARPAEFSTVLSNAFGFGGQNSTLLLAREAL